MQPGDCAYWINPEHSPIEKQVVIAGKPQNGLIPACVHSFGAILPVDLIPLAQLELRLPENFPPVTLFEIRTKTDGKEKIDHYLLAYSYDHASQMVLDDWQQMIFLCDGFKAFPIRAGLKGWDTGRLARKVAEFIKGLPND